MPTSSILASNVRTSACRKETLHLDQTRGNPSHRHLEGQELLLELGFRERQGSLGAASWPTRCETKSS